tara:strand:- start:11412 stop:11975 length:564 start_codon:yes stop_codon:yes gene_type:complete
MAIENLNVNATDLELRGGLRYIAISLFSDPDAVTFDNSDDHAISALGNVAGAKLFDLKQGTGSLTTSGSKEGGTIMFEHTVSFYVPNCSSSHLRALESMKNERLMVVCQDFNGQAYVVGISEAYGLEDDIANQQMFATLTSIEGGTGAALGDENGVTVTITAMSGELPRVFSGTFTPDSSAGTVAIS